MVVQLHLFNGTARSYGSVMVRVTLFGPGTARRAIMVPAGPMGTRGSKRLGARARDLEFEVERVAVELVFARH